MPCNIEIKAHLRDPVAATAIAAEIATSGPMQLAQCDTYFVCPHGRLKLRQHERQGDELIWYQRVDQREAKPSRYEIVPVQDAETLKEVLAGAWGIDAIVKKRRQLWLVDNVRIHLDDVESLGHFLEFEAVLDAAHQDADEAIGVVSELAQRMGVRPADHIARSYREMVREFAEPKC